MSIYPRATIGWRSFLLTNQCWRVWLVAQGGFFRGSRSPGVAYCCYNMGKSGEEPQEPDSDTETPPKTTRAKQKRITRNKRKTKKRKTPPQHEEQERLTGQKKQKVRLPYSCHLLFLIDPPPKTLTLPFPGTNPAPTHCHSLTIQLPTYFPSYFPKTMSFWFFCLFVSLPDTEDRCEGKIGSTEFNEMPEGEEINSTSLFLWAEWEKEWRWAKRRWNRPGWGSLYK